MCVCFVFRKCFPNNDNNNNNDNNDYYNNDDNHKFLVCTSYIQLVRTRKHLCMREREKKNRERERERERES